MKNSLIKLIFLTFLAQLVAGFLIFETPNQLDTPNPSDLDQCSSKLSLPDNITLSNATYGHIWVCNNGILSFSFADTRFIPEAFPLDETAIIAPLWSDVDIRGILEDEEANKITWRVEYIQKNLDHIDSLLREHTDVERFGATWAFVATWNRVGYFPAEIDLLNTFQVVITCNEQATKRCFCLLAYEDIQWTMTIDQQVHSQAGINDGSGSYENLPGSRTPEVRNLPSWSNVGKDGLFIYQLSDKGVAPKCKRAVSPIYANMFFEKENFLLSNFLCGISSERTENETLEVLFMGKSFNVTVNGTVTSDQLSVEGIVPFWGKGELVRVGLLLDGQFDNTNARNMHFVPAIQWVLKEPELEADVLSNLGSTMKVKLTWNRYHFDPSVLQQNSVMLKALVVQFPLNGSRGPFSFDVKHVEPITNGGSAIVEVSSFIGAVFLQLDAINSSLSECVTENISFGECTINPLTTEKPVFTKIGTVDCDQWITAEKVIRDKNSDQVWNEVVEKAFACPRIPGNRIWGTDADFARREIFWGLVGWSYDPCCGGTNEEFGYHEYCLRGESTRCPLNSNEQIDFCIQSPSLTVEESDQNDNVVQLHASNQCCYSEVGNLITSSDQKAGSTRKSSLTRTNFLEFYLSEIPPLKSCDSEMKRNSDGHGYYNVRPISPGDYIARLIRITWGDPHVTTFDGLEYTFNGLGVYTLTETLAGHPTNMTMQASTRRMGNGTVFSGFHMKDSSGSVEFYLNTINKVTVIIDEVEIDTGQLAQLDTDGVQFSRNNLSTEFSFKLMGSDFIVKAFVGEGGVVNLGLAPPFELNGTFQGLMGNFDSDPSNDLLTKDGNTVPTISQLSVIHDEFGESWAVTEKDWLFSPKVSVMIQEDMSTGSPYTPVYTAQFQSEELRRAAEEVCGNDERCLLDVSLTGDIAFVSNAVQMRELIETVEVLNEVALVAFHGESTIATSEFFSEGKTLTTLVATEAFREETTIATSEFFSADKTFNTLAATEAFREETTTAIPEFLSEEKRFTTLAVTEAFSEETTKATLEFLSEDKRFTTLAATEAFREETTIVTPDFFSEDERLTTLAATEVFSEETETSKDKEGLTLLSIMLITLGVMVALIVLIATIYILYVFPNRCSGNRVGVMPQKQAWES